MVISTAFASEILLVNCHILIEPTIPFSLLPQTNHPWTQSWKERSSFTEYGAIFDCSEP